MNPIFLKQKGRTKMKSYVLIGTGTPLYFDTYEEAESYAKAHYFVDYCFGGVELLTLAEYDEQRQAEERRFTSRARGIARQRLEQGLVDIDPDDSTDFPF